MNKTTKRNALISAVLAIMLCVSLISGATFALFTSESKVNIAVSAGNVEVVATIDEAYTLYSPTAIDMNGNIVDETNAATDEAFVNGGTVTLKDNLLTLTNVTPGDYVKFSVNVENKSNVAIIYRTVVKCTEDNGLFAGLKFTLVEGEEETELGTATVSNWTAWTVADEKVKTLTYKVELPADAGNDYQEKSCQICFMVEAAQGNADMPELWDGKTIEEPELKDGVYQINTPANLYAVMNWTETNSNALLGSKFVLNNDIDFGGAIIPGIGNDTHSFQSIFDGNNHTVSNFVIDRSAEDIYAGLFMQVFNAEITNLTVKDATVIGKAQVGAVVADAHNNAILKNLHAENCNVYAGKKVGGVVGYVDSQAQYGNLTSKNCNVYCEVSETTESAGKAPQASAVVGFDNNGIIIDGTTIDSTNVNVYFNAKYVADGVVNNNGVYEISNANGMFWFAAQADSVKLYADVKLTADIDLANKAWTPIGWSGTQYNGTFDGNGKTIKNLNVTTVGKKGSLGGYGLFGWTNGTIKDLTIDGATVIGSHYVGVIAGYVQKGTITGCTVKNATVKSVYADNTFDGDKAGAIAGYLNNGEFLPTIVNCKAEKCSVSAAKDAGQIVGAALKDNVSGCSASEVTVSYDNTNTPEGHTQSNINNAVIGRLL